MQRRWKKFHFFLWKRGGGTDIRIETDSLYSRIIVAGGGGGGGDTSADAGGAGGGENGERGQDGVASGTGGTQNSPGIYCVSTSYTCYKGEFGYGANSTNGPGAGGGWFGGSASNKIEGSGGGSGYVLTQNSFKPQGYLLNDTKYFLKDAMLYSGSQSFPSPTGTKETGHDGNGYAIITRLTPLRTPFITPFFTAMATLKATMQKIKPELKFSFTDGKGEVFNDTLGMFKFRNQEIYTSDVLEGKYVFYANGSYCGHTLLANHKIYKPSTMEINIGSDVMISINSRMFLRAPGEQSKEESFVKTNGKVLFNLIMNDYDCHRTAGASLLVAYKPLFRGTCRRNTRSSFEYILLLALVC